LRTFAVAVIVIVTGAGPQLNVMTPPRATASTTARDVQLAGVPVPTTRVGREVSTARASAGTAAPPLGFPAGLTGVPVVGGGFGFAAGVVGAAVVAAALVGADVAAVADSEGPTAAGAGSSPQADRATINTTAATARENRTRRC
jgi:hypothetical protein